MIDGKLIVSANRTKDPTSVLNVLQQIAATYHQDFEKYAKKAQVKHLEQLFRQIPHLVGKDFSYREIHGEYRKRELAPALELLERANIIHSIRYSSGQGIPIGAEVDFEIFKIIYLDIGLCQTILGSDISIWFLHPLEGFENRGEIAEGFIGQELICYASPDNKAELHFWKRKEKKQLRRNRLSCSTRRANCSYRSQKRTWQYLAKSPYFPRYSS